MADSVLRLLKKGQSDNRINCFRCGICCRYGCPMGGEEAQKISKHTGLPFSAFLEGCSQGAFAVRDGGEWFANGFTETNWIDDLDNYRTSRNDGGCVFLKAYPETHEVRCSIHTVRPPACDGYAPEIDRETCQLGLRKMWGITVTPLFSLEGNEEKLKAFYEFLRSILQ